MYDIHGSEPPGALEKAILKADKRTKKVRATALAELPEAKHDDEHKELDISHDIGGGDSDDDLALEMAQVGILEDDVPVNNYDSDGDERDDCSSMYITSSDEAGDTPPSSDAEGH